VRLDLPGKTVAITGAGGGLGSGLARALRARGANLALLDLTADDAQAAALGGDRHARGWAVDVRDFDAQQQVFADVAEHFGGVDVVVAGPASSGRCRR
jgi:NAD(P)-dependent dehydrogenase (short-subunit alcohol dehydrogenase family)